jgi:hypothetical protein
MPQAIMRSMARALFTIRDRLEVPGRGVAVVGLVPIGDELFSRGSPIEIRYIDGTTRHTQIASIELVSPHPPDHAAAVMFPLDITKADLPVGAEVWSVDS